MNRLLLVIRWWFKVRIDRVHLLYEIMSLLLQLLAISKLPGVEAFAIRAVDRFW